MNSTIVLLGAALLSLSLSSSTSLAQISRSAATLQPVAISFSPAAPETEGSSSSEDSALGPELAGAAYITRVPSGVPLSSSIHPFSTVGLDWHSGLNGAGFDVATPLSRTTNIRTGADFFSYATNFQEQGANVTADLRMLSGHASLDWFPFGGRFRLSPQLIFGNNNRLRATAIVPSGSMVTVNGQDFTSSYTDPLHGGGLIDFRKVSPGFTLGFGNIIPRTKSHFSMPIEAGFYYVGQPRLTVAFSGSACDPSQPPVIGCQSVANNAQFQQDLAAFIARNNNNLSYASFLPILSIGFGYKF